MIANLTMVGASVVAAKVIKQYIPTMSHFVKIIQSPDFQEDARAIAMVLYQNDDYESAAEMIKSYGAFPNWDVDRLATELEEAMDDLCTTFVGLPQDFYMQTIHEPSKFKAAKDT